MAETLEMQVFSNAIMRCESLNSVDVPCDKNGFKTSALRVIKGKVIAKGSPKSVSKISVLEVFKASLDNSSPNWCILGASFESLELCNTTIMGAFLPGGQELFNTLKKLILKRELMR